MALKKLNQFLVFDYAKFSHGKVIVCTGIGEWLDYNTKDHKGTKVEGAIIKDNTLYDQKNGESVSNLYEKIIFKCKKDIQIPVGAVITPVNAVAKAYGENGAKFVNQLSITCDDVKVLAAPQAKA